MTDFQRLITVLPREPEWTAPTAGQRHEVSEHAADLTDSTRPPRPDLRPEDLARIFTRQRGQFNDSTRAWFDGWLTSYQYYANNTPTGVSYHQQATALLYFILEGTLENPNAADVSSALHRFNEQWGHYREDLLSSTVSAERKASELNGILLPSAMALLQRISASTVAGDENVARELAALANHVGESYRGLIQVAEGQPHLEFLREYPRPRSRSSSCARPRPSGPFRSNSESPAPSRGIFNDRKRRPGA
jgi:hypothetical protein